MGFFGGLHVRITQVVNLKALTDPLLVIVSQRRRLDLLDIIRLVRTQCVDNVK